MKKRLWIHGPAVLWTLLVTFALLFPRRPGETPRPPRLPPVVMEVRDLSAHVVLFLGMAYVLHRSFRSVEGLARPLRVAVLSAFLYGGVMEVAQMGVAGRGAQLVDVVSNGAGAVLYALGHRRRTGREASSL